MSDLAYDCLPFEIAGNYGHKIKKSSKWYVAFHVLINRQILNSIRMHNDSVSYLLL